VSRRTVAAASRRRGTATVDPTLLMAVAGSSGTGTGFSTTVTATTTTTLPVGTLLVVGSTRLCLSGDTTGVSSIAVSAGALGTVTEAGSAVRANTSELSVHGALVTTSIPSGSTVTVTFRQTAARKAVILAAFSQVTSGVAETSSGVFSGGDGGTSAGPNGSSTSPTATATAANTTARALVIGACTLTLTHTFTPGTGYTEVAEASSSSTGGNDRGLEMEWKFVTVTGTESMGGTISATQVWASVVATFPLTA
jgi:hypothetical protein